MTSKASKLSKNEVNALRLALREANQRSRVLESENQELKKIIRKLKLRQSASQQRQRKKSIEGMLKTPKYKTASIKLPKLHQDVKKQILKDDAKRAADARTELFKDMTPQEQYNYHMDTLYIPRFFDRMNERFGISGQLTQKQEAMLANVMKRFTKDQLDTVIRALDLANVYYESDDGDLSTTFSGDATDLVNKIMDQANQAGLLSDAEFLFYMYWKQQTGLDIGKEDISSILKAKDVLDGEMKIKKNADGSVTLSLTKKGYEDYIDAYDEDPDFDFTDVETLEQFTGHKK